MSRVAAPQARCETDGTRSRAGMAFGSCQHADLRRSGNGGVAGHPPFLSERCYSSRHGRRSECRRMQVNAAESGVRRGALDRTLRSLAARQAFWQGTMSVEPGEQSLSWKRSLERGEQQYRLALCGPSAVIAPGVAWGAGVNFFGLAVPWALHQRARLTALCATQESRREDTQRGLHWAAAGRGAGLFENMTGHDATTPGVSRDLRTILRLSAVGPWPWA